MKTLPAMPALKKLDLADFFQKSTPNFDAFFCD